MEGAVQGAQDRCDQVEEEVVRLQCQEDQEKAHGGRYQGLLRECGQLDSERGSLPATGWSRFTALLCGCLQERNLLYCQAFDLWKNWKTSKQEKLDNN